MFTGIIENLGIVAKNEKEALEIKTALKDISAGDSVSVNGACLTVTGRKTAGSFAIIRMDVSEETRRRTNLGLLKPSDRVNIERSMSLNSRLGGHFVTGHVHCTGSIKSVKKNTGSSSSVFVFAHPPEIKRYLVEKGSVAVDGISLTVAGAGKNNEFSVWVIPYTLVNTTLGFKKEGASVNLEPDILAKYAENALAKGEPGKSITAEFLKDKGFF